MSLRGNVLCWELYPFHSMMHHLSLALKGTLKISNNNFKLGKLLGFFFSWAVCNWAQELMIPSEQYGKYVELLSRTVNYILLCAGMTYKGFCWRKHSHVEFFWMFNADISLSEGMGWGFLNPLMQCFSSAPCFLFLSLNRADWRSSASGKGTGADC